MLNESRFEEGKINAKNIRENHNEKVLRQAEKTDKKPYSQKTEAVRASLIQPPSCEEIYITLRDNLNDVWNRNLDKLNALIAHLIPEDVEKFCSCILLSGERKGETVKVDSHLGRDIYPSMNETDMNADLYNTLLAIFHETVTRNKYPEFEPFLEKFRENLTNYLIMENRLVQERRREVDASGVSYQITEENASEAARTYGDEEDSHTDFNYKSRENRLPSFTGGRANNDKDEPVEDDESQAGALRFNL